MVESPVLDDKLLPRAKIRHLWFNIILLLIGAAVLSVSIPAKTHVLNELTILDQYESLNLTVAIAFSAVLIVIGAIGAIASSRFSSRLIKINGSLLMIFLLASIGYRMWSYMNTDYSRKGSLFRQLRSEQKHYEVHKDSVNFLQYTLSCCGVNDYTDWGNSIPSSCCKTGESCDSESPTLKREGCYGTLSLILSCVSVAVTAGVVFASLVEIGIITLAVALYRAAKDKEREEKTTKEVEEPPEEVEIKIPRVRDFASVVSDTVITEPFDKVEEPIEEIVIPEEPTDATETETERKNDASIRYIVLNFF